MRSMLNRILVVLLLLCDMQLYMDFNAACLSQSLNTDVVDGKDKDYENNTFGRY